MVSENQNTYRFKGPIRYQGMAIRRRIFIVIFCDVFTAGLWYLRGCRLTGPTSRTPSSPIKVIVGSRYFINSTAVILQKSFCIHLKQIGNQEILSYVLK